MAVKIKHKRGTAANIGSANPTLASGELGFETDTLRFKLGDGTTAWDSLAYVNPYVSTTDRLLGRSTAGAGAVEEITCTAFGRSLIDDADASAARATLNVQPSVSPAFTGAATFENTGNVVPLTVTNAGTANSFVVNDASGDTSPFVIDAAGNVGVGASSVESGFALHVNGDVFVSNAASNATQISVDSVDQRLILGTYYEFGVAAYSYISATNNAETGDTDLQLRTGTNTRLTISSTGTATFAGQIVGQAGADISGTTALGDTVNIGTASAGNTIVNVGVGATGDRFAITDYIGDTTYTDFGLRVGRSNGGANGNSIIQHRGTGVLAVTAIDAGSMVFATSNTTRLTISSTGTATFAGQIVGQAGAEITGTTALGDTVNIGTASTTATIVNVGVGATGNRFALIDVIGDTTYTDYGLRIGRDNGGANGQSIIHHRGTGSLAVVALDAGTVELGTNSTTRLSISSTGTATFTGQILADDIATANSVAYGFDGDTNTGVGRAGADILTLVTGGSERVRVKATGSVRFVPLSADPASGNEAGDVYYNSSTNKLRVYNGTSWVDLH